MYLGDANAAFPDEDGKLNQMSERDQRLVAIMEEEMLQSYQKYFEKNYYGNRAPVHVGHHFSRWNQGAYWRAFKRFAENVCGMPEVRCVTYRELADFMDEADHVPGLRSAFQAGRFEKASAPPVSLTRADKVYDLNVKLQVQENEQIQPQLIGADAQQISQQLGRRQLKQEFLLNGWSVPTKGGKGLSLKDVRSQVPQGATADLTVRLVGPDKAEVHSSTFELKYLGTPFEKVSDTSMEEQLNVFDPPEAHEE
jgi:hypothetical protein